MSLSYGELAAISEMSDQELEEEYHDQNDRLEKHVRTTTVDGVTATYTDEDREDTINAILGEMESRGLPHP